MMKNIFLLILTAAANLSGGGQIANIDSLKQLLTKSQPDTNKVKLLLDLSLSYYFTNPDISLLYSEKADSLAKELNFVKGEIFALHNAGESLRFLGDFPHSLQKQFRALELARKIEDRNTEASSLGFIGFTYMNFKEYRQGLNYMFPSVTLNRQIKNQLKETFDLSNISYSYNLLGMADSALYYSQLALKTYTGLAYVPLKSLIQTRLANAFFSLGQKDSALKYYHTSLANSRGGNSKVSFSETERQLAELHKSNMQYDSSLYYAQLSFINGKQSLQRLELLETSELLVSLFRQKQNHDSAFFYQDFANAMKDSLYGPKRFKQLQLLMLSEQQRQQKAEQEQLQFRNKIKYIILFIVLGVFLLTSFLLFRNNQHKQKAKKKIENAYKELKETQQQLVQREKMASLGELTAGIAHEIQNPLNFVNNFSDVNAELLDDLKTELAAGNTQSANKIADDIKENEKKINHHGKRADAIVKNMLQHSRSSAGKKEPVSINALCNEYLRLSYNGLRVKDKSFNATMKTDFDENIARINIVPQDIGRVILNLINNAFYAVDEKMKSGIENYEPAVTVSTKKVNGKIEIKVADNGNGIPQKALDKIFQPFFTTKPTGQGTGLGLSLAYDIVKAHGGEIKVETKERQGTEFTILL